MILLDTHVLLWATADPSRLSRQARRVIEKAQREAATAVAAITLFELASLAQTGRIRLPVPLPRGIQAVLSSARATVCELTVEVAVEAARLPRTISDPVDRMVAATAIVHDLALVTKDAALQDSPLLKTIW